MWICKCDKHFKGDMNVTLRAYNRDSDAGKVVKEDFRIWMMSGS